MTDDTPSWPKGADDFLDRFDPPPGLPDVKSAMMEELRLQAIEIDKLHAFIRKHHLAMEYLKDK